LEVRDQQKFCLKKLTGKYILGLTIHQEFPKLSLNKNYVVGGKGTGLPGFMNSSKIFRYASKFCGRLGAI
jgi:hypothetical protein